MIRENILVVVLAAGSLSLTDTATRAEDVFRDRIAPSLNAAA